jgi:hypothetical protein
MEKTKGYVSEIYIRRKQVTEKVFGYFKNGKVKARTPENSVP